MDVFEAEDIRGLDKEVERWVKLQSSRLRPN
jgi:hypothetical protein